MSFGGGILKGEEKMEEDVKGKGQKGERKRENRK
jgi:hypothetical protein